MTYQAHEGPDTTMAGVAHLGAITGPVVPLFVWLNRRGEDAFAAREAAKATNFGMLALVVFVSATAVARYVPLVGFVGRIVQVLTIAIAIALCAQAFITSRKANPAAYPASIRVVPTGD